MRGHRLSPMGENAFSDRKLSSHNFVAKYFVHFGGRKLPNFAKQSEAGNFSGGGGQRHKNGGGVLEICPAPLPTFLME